MVTTIDFLGFHYSVLRDNDGTFTVTRLDGKGSRPELWKHFKNYDDAVNFVDEQCEQIRQYVKDDLLVKGVYKYV